MEYWGRRCKENACQYLCLEGNLSSHLILPYTANKEGKVHRHPGCGFQLPQFQVQSFFWHLAGNGVDNLEVTSLEKGCKRGSWKPRWHGMGDIHLGWTATLGWAAGGIEVGGQGEPWMPWDPEGRFSLSAVITISHLHHMLPGHHI